MIGLRAAGATDVGRVRETNQDAFLTDEGLYVVADGVGGHRGGEVASATAVEALRATFHVRTITGLIEAVLRSNRAVWERAQTDPNLRGMGTTLTAVALVHAEDDDEERLGVVNVGDSRGYLLQQGELSQLTEDHSLVEEMVREGRLTREEADIHPQRSLITRALGLEANVLVDHWELIPYAGDRILLCSDGLTNELSDDRIASVLRRLADPQEAAKELVAEARASGGRDNITVVVVDVVDDEHRAERASAALATEPARADATHAERAPAPADRPGGDTDDTDDTDDGPAAVATPVGGADILPAAAPARTRPPLLTWRVLAFALLLLLVLGGAASAVDWYARRTYYVGVKDGRVAIFRGHPGGLLWFGPTLAEPTAMALADVPPSRLDEVKAGRQEANLAAARRYVRNLQDEAAATRAAAGTTTSTSSPPTATTGRPSP